MIRKAVLYARRLLPQGVRKQIYRFGVAFGDASLALPHTYLSLKMLRAEGFQPRCIVDVGAYEGYWTQSVKEIFPSAKVLMVEAQQNKSDCLARVCQQSSDVQYEIALLGSQAGASVMFSEMETGSSVFEEQSDFPRQRNMRVTSTLDLIAERLKLEHIDFLKLDVQGYELEVLKGGSTVLSRCACVLLETSIAAINKGCPLLPEVLAFMDRAGFRVRDLCSQLRTPKGTLLQTDVLFVRSNSQWVPPAYLSSDNWYS